MQFRQLEMVQFVPNPNPKRPVSRRTGIVESIKNLVSWSWSTRFFTFLWGGLIIGGVTGGLVHHFTRQEYDKGLSKDGPLQLSGNFLNGPDWLLAGTGTCKSINYVQHGWTDNDNDNIVTFRGNISFEFHTSNLLAFTDAPYHQSYEIFGNQSEVAQLSAPQWNHKNIAIAVDGDIATFQVLKHETCAVEDDSNDCVKYTGYVSSNTDGFQLLDDNSTACQLFVDSTKNTSPSPPSSPPSPLPSPPSPLPSPPSPPPP